MPRHQGELELYLPMAIWLKNRLQDIYGEQTSQIKVIDCHSKYLDKVLTEEGVIEYYPGTQGLKIQIDIIGIVVLNSVPKLFFIEAKNTRLNLHDVGQILVYSKLCEPEESYLLGSKGLGNLYRLFTQLDKQYLLEYSLNPKVKKSIKIGSWNKTSNDIDYSQSIMD